MDKPDFTAFFDRYAEKGYMKDLLPVIPPDAKLSHASKIDKKQLGKIPGKNLHDGWVGFSGWAQHVTTKEDIKKYKKYREAGVCLNTRCTPAVDIDVTDEDLADIIEEIAKKNLGDAPVRTGNKPKRLLLYRGKADHGFKKKILTIANSETGVSHAVEVLSDGQQCIVQGIHPKTGKPYTWSDRDGKTDLPPRVSLTEVTEEKINAFLRKVQSYCELAGYQCSLSSSAKTKKTKDKEKSHNQESDRRLPIGSEDHIADLDKLQDALAALPNDIEEYQEWMTFNHALKAALGGKEEHYHVFEGWNLQWPENKPRYVREKWNSIHDSSVGAEYIYRCARKAGWDDTRYDFDAIFDDEEQEKAEKHDDKHVLFKPIPYSKLRVSDANQWLIRGVLQTVGLSALSGASNAGKSFCAVDVGMHIALGVPWHGLETQQGTVVYIAAEDPEGIQKRAMAAGKRLNAPSDTPFYVITDAPLFSGEAKHLKPLYKQIKKCKGSVSLIIIDTLSMTFGGGNENDSAQMMTFVHNISKLWRKMKTQILLVHHIGKDEGRGMRGHNSLLCSVFTHLELKEDKSGGLRTIKIDKQRNGQKGTRFAFTLSETVFIGDPEKHDEFERDDLCIPCVVPAPAAKIEESRKNQKNAPNLESLRDLILIHGRDYGSAGVPAVLESDWREHFVEMYMEKKEVNREAARKAYDRTKATLQENDLIGMKDGWVWII
jgi:hypothetical protein